MASTEDKFYTFYEDQLNIPDYIEKLRREKKESFEDSLLVCDLSDIIKKFNHWKEYFPRVLPFYAVKCNNLDPILLLLARLGTSFDCASKVEISKIRSLGISADRIIYANTVKQISHLNYAKEAGVKRITFDNESELYKIKEHHPDAELIIRIRYAARASLVTTRSKFGCDAEKDAPELMQLAKRLGLKLIGVSFHIGFLVDDYDVYGRAITACKKVFDEAESIGIALEVLDIGGGYPRDVWKLQKIAAIVNDRIDTLFANKNIKIIAEPGNYFVSSAFTLITKIHSKRDFVDDGMLKKMYYINAGYHNAFSFALSHNEFPTNPIPLADNNGPLFQSMIWGPTCDSLDKVCDSIMLPKLDINDILIFPNQGAYTIPIRNAFNGFPVASIDSFINIIHKDIVKKIEEDIIKYCSN